MEKDKYNFGLLFAGIPISEEEKFRVMTEIQKIGGLTFSEMTKNEDGWVTHCDQIEGIIAGGKNPNPTNSEIENEIRQAILSAFNVKLEETPIKSPFVFEYSY